MYVQSPNNSTATTESSPPPAYTSLDPLVRQHSRYSRADSLSKPSPLISHLQCSTIQIATQLGSPHLPLPARFVLGLVLYVARVI